jgi:hypothetical protein
MCNAQNPGQKLTVVLILSAIQRFNNLDKCILKDVLSEMLILDEKKDIGVYLFSISVDEQFKTVHIAADELGNKLLVS